MRSPPPLLKRQSDQPELTKQAQAFRDAQIGFNVALENFENKAGPSFLKTMTGLVNASAALLGDFEAAHALVGDGAPTLSIVLCIGLIA